MSNIIREETVDEQGVGVKTTVLNIDELLKEIEKIKDDVNNLGEVIEKHSRVNREQKAFNKQLKEQVDFLTEAHKYSLSRIIMAILKKKPENH